MASNIFFFQDENSKKEKGNKKEQKKQNNGVQVKPSASPEAVEKLKAEITKQGELVRELKTSGAEKVIQLLDREHHATSGGESLPL